MDLLLRGRNVLVTGAGQGVGRAIGDAFAGEGANVAYHYLNSGDGARQAAEEASASHNVKAIAVKGDISDHAAVSDIVGQVHDGLGTVDILVNNAAFTGKPGIFLDSDPDDWRPQFEVTLFGTFLLTQAFLPDLIASGTGSIVTLAGESGRVGESQAVITSATRAGALGFTRALAKEVARHKVRVNAVALGLTETPTTKRDVFDRVSPEILDRIRKAYPLRRFGQPADVTPLVLMLASPLTGWVTGQTYGINGGYFMA